MVKWRLRLDGRCPYCSCENENKMHVLSCSHHQALEEWENHFTTYLERLQSIDTSPLLMYAIASELSEWRMKTASLFAAPPPGRLSIPILNQRNIGWHLFLEGLISSSILLYQEEYLIGKDKPWRFQSWSRQFYTAGWSLLFALWNERNSKLHHTEFIHDMEGQQALNRAIALELRLGRSHLPHRFQYFFHYSEEDALKQSLKWRRSWFSAVRKARENFDDPNLITDCFTQLYTRPINHNCIRQPIRNPARIWVGLCSYFNE